MRCHHCEEYDIPDQEIEYPANAVEELKDKIFELETQIEDQKELIKSVPLFNVTGTELSEIIAPLLAAVPVDTSYEEDSLEIAMGILQALGKR